MGSKDKSGKFNKIIKRVGISLGVILVMMLVASIALFSRFKTTIASASENGSMVVDKITDESFRGRQATAIYDRNGDIITEIQDHEYVYIPLSETGKNIQNSFLATEDVRFYDHNGIDYRGLMRASIELVRNRGEITQGGSTITQQLVKNVFLTHKQTYDRKLQEMYIARKIEKVYTKEQILEFYLNNIYFGRGAHGVEAAARKYFNKSSKDLTIEESALLTGLTNNPTQFDPVEHKDVALAKRNSILEKMEQHGYITAEEYEKAVATDLNLDMSRKFKQDFTLDSAPVSFALWSATKVMMEQEGFEFKYWFDKEEERAKYKEEYDNLYGQINSRIRNGGYKIYSTIDMDKQISLQKSVNEGLSGFSGVNSETGLYEIQGSAVTIDNNNGDVVAIVGGRTQEEVENMLNRAIFGPRQPGSTIKPLLSYTPAFEKGRLPSMSMRDEEIEGGPKNYDQKYRGYVTLRDAVHKSYNTIPFKLAQEFGTENLIPYLEKMEFANLAPNDIYPSISVGGFTYGTTTLEMASAYATIARNGEFISPVGIEEIKSLSNEVIYKNPREKVRVYDPGSAYVMTDVLKGVLSERGSTAYGFSLSNMATAGKTGTTNEDKDAWFVAYTPHYTTATWVGGDQPQTIKSGGMQAKKIWKSYMDKIHSGLAYSDFKMNDRVSYMYVNPRTHKVSKTAVSGWKKELVPEVYFELQESGELEKILKNQQKYNGAPKSTVKQEQKKRTVPKKTSEAANKKATEAANKKAAEAARIKAAEEAARKAAEETARKAAAEEAARKAAQEAQIAEQQRIQQEQNVQEQNDSAEYSQPEETNENQNSTQDSNSDYDDTSTSEVSDGFYETDYEYNDTTESTEQ